MKKYCIQCNKEFEKNYNSSRAYFARQKFCSKKCFGDSRLGIVGAKRSEETKKKMRIANKNNKSGIENGIKTRFSKGMISIRKGKHFPKNSGENAYQWKGGISRFPKCIDCNKQLTRYDSKRCQPCLAKFCVGVNHPRFKHGLSKTQEYKAHYGRIKQDKRRGATGSHTSAEWQELKKKFDYMCLCCKKVEPFITLTRDHIIPLSKGGSNDISNIQPLCGSCNSSKYTEIKSYLPIIRSMQTLIT